ncbi:hypothetical protein GN157_00295 [Flavobacterium rakeshii]|uniref:Uncharacterized protein n=1 Tax=Flavobacterium rakeshii TaxID=1038845 RepID=A0A6N8HAF0_9FLAO|nr:hypothetical protein [Flavobacterium rakeshii]MEE1898074.1 hypothetical protein [Flavobacterium rakeshii]MUV02136.1 hypothetical protein [Flavobacterium rakeshii]
MKKLALPFIFCVSTLFYFSCSSDIDNATDNQQPESVSFQLKSMPTDSINKAARMYVLMTQTQDYIGFKSSISAFNSKVAPNRVSFSSKSEWMNWISGNISKTGFTTVTQFENMYDDFVTKFDLLMQNNDELFKLIELAANDTTTLLQIFQPELMPQPEPLGDVEACKEACMDATSTAIDVENHGFVQQLFLAVYYLRDYEFASSAIQDHEMAINHYIPMDLNICMHDCERNGGSE